MGHIPRKRFGQHFLHDKNVIQRIIEAVAADENTPIVEIGPGPGALTIPLLKTTGTLDVVEIDRDLAKILIEKCSEIGNLNLHLTDALKFDFCSLKPGKIKIVGNLPYNISTPLLFHLLMNIHCIESMLFMMQKEVVDRICAGPNSRDYGRLSVMVQSECEVHRLFDIAAGAFHPPPKVASSIIRLIPKSVDDCYINNKTMFSHIVKQAFGQRRKTIRNSLKGLVDESTFAKIGIASTSRAENLSLDDFRNLANSQHGSDNQ